MRAKLFCITLILVLLGNISLFAEDGFRERQRAFIFFLFDSGRYFDAAGETCRYMALSGERDPELNYFITANYFLGRQYLWTIDHITSAAGGPADVRSRILLSQSFLKLGDAWQATAAMSGAVLSDLDPSIRYDVMLRRVEALLCNDDYGKAHDEVLASSCFFKEEKGFIALAGDLERYRELRYRSGAAAMIMSALVPGAGQVYAGRYLDGLLSLIGVAATLGGGLYLYERGQKGPAFSLFFFSGLFYGGTIYGAWNSCRSHNAAVNDRFRREILGRHVPPFDPMRYIDRNALFR